MSDKLEADGRLLVSAHDAARMLNISERTLWSVTTPRGTLVCVRIGSRVLYSPESLRSWIAAKANGSRPNDCSTEK